MAAVENFPQLPVILPETAILKRLGGNRHLTAIPPAQMRQIRGWMSEAFAACALCARAAVLTIRARGADWVELENGVRWSSARLAETLAPCARAAVFAVTAGAAPGELAARALRENRGAAALVYDATASETVDAAAGWLEQFLRQRHGAAVCARHRFSPGYGGWALSAQADIMETLALAELGITRNDSFQLSPEKTVTAVLGV